MADRELKVIITGDPSSLQRAFKKSSSASDGLGKSFLKVGKAAAVMGAAIGGAVVVGAVKAIDAASDLGEQIAKTGVVFGDNAKDVHNWSEDLAASFGLSQRAALEASGTFGNMLVPMGFSRKEAAKMSKQFVELGADMASFNNADPSETLDALRAGLAGETEPLRRFGVFLNDARIKAEAASQGFKLVKGQLDPMAKAAATAAIIMKDTADTQGDFGRTSDSLANQQRVLRAELENAAASIGQALLPAATELMGLLARAAPVVGEFVTKLTEMAAPFISSAVEQLAPAFQNVKQSVTELIAQVRQLLPTLQSIGTTVLNIGFSQFGQSAIVATVSMVTMHGAITRLITAFTALRTAAAGAGIASLIGTAGLLTAAIGLLAFAFYNIVTSSDAAASAYDRQKAALDNLNDAADESVSATQRVKDARTNMRQAILNEKNATDALVAGRKSENTTARQLEQLEINVAQAKNNTKRATTELRDATENATSKTKDNAAAIRNLTTEAKQATTEMGKTAKGLQETGNQAGKHAVVKSYATQMLAVAERAKEVAARTKESNPLISTAATNFAKTATAAANYAKRTGEIPKNLKAAVSGARTAGADVGDSFGQGIAAGIGRQSPVIAAAAATAVRNAKAAADAAARAKSPSELFAELGRDIGLGLRDGIVKQYATLKDAAKTAIDTMISASVSAVQNGKSKLSEAVSSLVSGALSAFDALHSGVKTAAEKALAAFDLTQAKAQAAKQLKELKDAVIKAQEEIRALQAKGAELEPQREGETSDEFAKRRLAAEEQYQEQLTRLREQEAAAQLAVADEIAAQALAKQRAALEKRAEQSRKKEDDQTALERYQFEKRLGNLTRALEGGHISQKQFNERLLKLYKEYEIPLHNRGKALGLAVAAGLNDAEDAVRNAANRLADIMEEAFARLSIEVSVKANKGAKPGNKRALGGPVRRGQPYIVGEQGAELFVPRQSGKIVPNGGGAGGGGAGTYVFNFPNYVGDRRDLERQMQQVMRRFEDSNGISFTGRSL